MRWTGVDFPAIFGVGGLRGMVATRDIRPYEGVLFVPNKLLMTVEKVRMDVVLAKIIEENEGIFLEEEHSDYNIIVLFLLHERSKGKII